MTAISGKTVRVQAIAACVALIGATAFAGSAEAAAIRIEGPSIHCNSLNLPNDGSTSLVIGDHFGQTLGTGDCSGDGSDSTLEAFSVNVFGTTYSSLFLNQNGSISFGSAFSGTDPSTAASFPFPVFAAFATDLTAISADPFVAWGWFETTSDSMTFQWHTDDTNVFSDPTAPFMEAQLVLTNLASSGSPGDFRVEFNYSDFPGIRTGGLAAFAGVTDGQGGGYAFPGSNLAGAFDNVPGNGEPDCANPGTGANSLSCGSLNSGVAGRYSLTFRNGQPIDLPQTSTVPEPDALALFAILGAGLIAARSLRGRRQRSSH